MSRAPKYDPMDLRPADEWHEDIGSALWWLLPIESPPYCGDPLTSTWPNIFNEEEFRHRLFFSTIPRVWEGEQYIQLAKNGVFEDYRL